MLYGTVRCERGTGTGNEKAGYYMGTDHRINAVTMAAALLGAVLLGGCSHTSYEKITVVETDAQQAEGTGKTEENLAAERIEVRCRDWDYFGDRRSECGRFFGKCRGVGTEFGRWNAGRKSRWNWWRGCSGSFRRSGRSVRFHDDPVLW